MGADAIETIIGSGISAVAVMVVMLIAAKVYGVC
jgi:hypothetical protein